MMEPTRAGIAIPISRALEKVQTDWEPELPGCFNTPPQVRRHRVADETSDPEVGINYGKEDKTDIVSWPINCFCSWLLTMACKILDIDNKDQPSWIYILRKSFNYFRRPPSLPTTLHIPPYSHHIAHAGKHHTPLSPSQTPSNIKSVELRRNTRQGEVVKRRRLTPENETATNAKQKSLLGNNPLFCVTKHIPPADINSEDNEHVSTTKFSLVGGRETQCDSSAESVTTTNCTSSISTSTANSSLADSTSASPAIPSLTAVIDLNVAEAPVNVTVLSRRGHPRFQRNWGKQSTANQSIFENKHNRSKPAISISRTPIRKLRSTMMKLTPQSIYRPILKSSLKQSAMANNNPVKKVQFTLDDSLDNIMSTHGIPTRMFGGGSPGSLHVSSAPPSLFINSPLATNPSGLNEDCSATVLNVPDHGLPKLPSSVSSFPLINMPVDPPTSFVLGDVVTFPDPVSSDISPCPIRFDSHGYPVSQSASGSGSPSTNTVSHSHPEGSATVGSAKPTALSPCSGDVSSSRVEPPSTPTCDQNYLYCPGWESDGGAAELFGELDISGSAQKLLAAAQLEREIAEAKRRAEEEARRLEEEAIAAAQAEEESRKARLERRVAKRKFIQPLSLEWEMKISEAIQKGDQAALTTTVSGTELRRRDLMTVLAPRDWLNDEVINGYLEWVVEHVNAMAGTNGRTSVPRVAAFNSFFYKKLASDGAKPVLRWSKRKRIDGVKLLEVDNVLIPVNNASHWTLLVVSGTKRTVEYLDSFNGSPKVFVKNALDWVRAELGAAFIEDEWKILNTPSPHQSNNYDCGVFCITNAELVALGIKVESYDAGDMAAQRRRIAAVLLARGFGGELVAGDGS
jgi:hypothetical protein